MFKTYVLGMATIILVLAFFIIGLYGGNLGLSMMNESSDIAVLLGALLALGSYSVIFGGLYFIGLLAYNVYTTLLQERLERENSTTNRR